MKKAFIYIFLAFVIETNAWEITIKGNPYLFDYQYPQIENPNIELNGILAFTGVLYLLDVFSYDNGNIKKTMYYLNGLENKKANQGYTHVRGSIHTLGDKRLVEVVEIKNKDREFKNFSKKIGTLCKEVIQNRGKYDLNSWKENGLLKEFTLNRIKSKNLNLLPFRNKKEVLFWDFESKVIGVDCGQVVLEENILTGSYLHYIAITHPKSDHLQIKEVLVKNSGYFHE
jgi:hypothetical protein